MDQKITRTMEGAAKLLLTLLILAILSAMLGGIICTFRDITHIFSQELHEAFRTILIDLLMVLALVELLRTALAYFTEGRVKVTYIIDTVIVVVLTEVMGFWYRDVRWEEMAMVIALVVSLAGVRIIAVRFSPKHLRQEL